MYNKILRDSSIKTVFKQQKYTKKTAGKSQVLTFFNTKNKGTRKKEQNERKIQERNFEKSYTRNKIA